jgi:hypothetical protein
MGFNKKKIRTAVAAFAVIATVVVPISAHADNSAPKGDLIFVRNQDFAIQI